MGESEILVSVLCITYNQVKYVRETLEGILMQKTDFLYEVLIHDDASSDGTVDILQEYEKKYPELIYVVYEKENQWGKGHEYNHDFLLPHAKGKYIAFCEGDDAWIDDRKLQIQAGYMEKHPECSLTLHKAYLQYPAEYAGKRMPRAMGYGTEGRLSFEEIFSEWRAPTSSFLFRRSLYEAEPLFFRQAPTGDEPLVYYMATEGEIYYFDRVMSVYNRLAEGSWTSKFSVGDRENVSNQTRHFSGYVNFLDKLDEYMSHEKQELIYSFIKDKIIGMFNYIMVVFERYSEMMEVAQQFNNQCDEIWTDYIVERMRGFWFYDQELFVRKLKPLIKDKELYIYGAGRLGKKTADQLMEYGCIPKGYLVTVKSTGTVEYNGIPLYEINEFEENKDKCFVLVSVSNEFAEDIIGELKREKFKNYLWPFALLYDEE